MAKELPTTLFEKCKPNQFIMAQNACSIYEVVRSGDVMPDAEFAPREEGSAHGTWSAGGTFAPDACVMRCYWASSKHPEKSQFKKGDITIDYFKEKFYGPFTKMQADVFVKIFEKSHK